MRGNEQKYIPDSYIKCSSQYVTAIPLIKSMKAVPPLFDGKTPVLVSYVGRCLERARYPEVLMMD